MRAGCLVPCLIFVIGVEIWIIKGRARFLRWISSPCKVITLACLLRFTLTTLLSFSGEIMMVVCTIRIANLFVGAALCRHPSLLHEQRYFSSKIVKKLWLKFYVDRYLDYLTIPTYMYVLRYFRCRKFYVHLNEWNLNVCRVRTNACVCRRTW